MKKIAIMLSIIFPPLVYAITPPAIESFKQSDVFSNWLLSRCIAKLVTSEDLKNDARKSASAWLEVSRLSIDAFHDGDVLIDNYLKLNLSGSGGGDFNILKCTLVSKSKESNAIFKKYYK